MPLSDDQAAQVEQKVLARGGRASHALFRQALRRAVLAVDPDGAWQRHDRQRRTRHVRLRPVDDGMAELWALLPAADAQTAFTHTDSLARRTAGPDDPGGIDDPRGMDERRADVLTDLLLGRRHHDTPVRVEIGVVVPATTLLGLTDTPGELAGHGPIPAPMARAMAEHATWRRILTDPADGSLLEVGRRRFPSPMLARHIHARDRTCRFPGCRKPATACDIDHVRPYVDGGTTRPGNLVTACRHHHRMKHEGNWTVERADSGTVIWTSPEKRVYRTVPEPYIDRAGEPGPDPPPF